MFRMMFVAAAWVAFLACGAAVAPARADAVLHVGKAFAGVFDFVPVDVGIGQGFFKKRGLEIKESNFAGSAKLQQALAADAIDIGLELAFVARGAPVKGVAAFMGPPADLTLFVKNELSLQTVKGVKGKKISVSSVSSLTELLVRQLSRHEGWGADGITTVRLGARPAQIFGAQFSRLLGPGGGFDPMGIAYLTFETEPRMAARPVWG